MHSLYGMPISPIFLFTNVNGFISLGVIKKTVLVNLVRPKHSLTPLGSLLYLEASFVLNQGGLLFLHDWVLPKMAYSEVIFLKPRYSIFPV